MKCKALQTVKEDGRKAERGARSREEEDGLG